MKREEMIDRIAHAIALHEGFFVTMPQAAARRIAYPTRAQVNCNPGNIRTWAMADGKQYPRTAGFVDFRIWAGEDEKKGQAEGWRVLRVLIGRYVDGKYHGGKSPTLEEMFAVYAPAADQNDPSRYARFVAREVGIQQDAPLASLI